MEQQTAILGKKWTAIIIGLLVLMVLALFLGSMLDKKQNTGHLKEGTYKELEPGVETVNVVRTDVATAQLPQGLPANLPIERGAAITKNYVQKGSNGITESVREYETSKSLTEIEDSYVKYFQASGYTVASRAGSVEAGFIAIAAVKGKQHILVNISENTISKVKKVEITASVTP